ncbi:hypothetical protein SALB1_2089 [Salinisphaera sp. LB1]|nr:hypothetical protein [Salinisphaera sp. LB1]AWN16287.1 hypothetical protein SALB1_2089 [Salinisphaera sp. LB1]
MRELAEHSREVFWMTNPPGDEPIYTRMSTSGDNRVPVSTKTRENDWSGFMQAIANGYARRSSATRHTGHTMRASVSIDRTAKSAEFVIVLFRHAVAPAQPGGWPGSPPI